MLLNHYSKYPFVVLGDYGAMLSLAEAQAIFEARRNSPGAGTPVYMPVEQVDRRCEVAAVGPKTDVWALGCCLLEVGRCVQGRRAGGGGAVVSGVELAWPIDGCAVTRQTVSY